MQSSTGPSASNMDKRGGPDRWSPILLSSARPRALAAEACLSASPTPLRIGPSQRKAGVAVVEAAASATGPAAANRRLRKDRRETGERKPRAHGLHNLRLYPMVVNSATAVLDAAEPIAEQRNSRSKKPIVRRLTGPFCPIWVTESAPAASVEWPRSSSIRNRSEERRV